MLRLPPLILFFLLITVSLILPSLAFSSFFFFHFPFFFSVTQCRLSFPYLSNGSCIMHCVAILECLFPRFGYVMNRNNFHLERLREKGTGWIKPLKKDACVSWYKLPPLLLLLLLLLTRISPFHPQPSNLSYTTTPEFSKFRILKARDTTFLLLWKVILPPCHQLLHPHHLHPSYKTSKSYEIKKTGGASSINHCAFKIPNSRMIW